MKYFLIFGLTLILSCSIIVIRDRRDRLSYSKKVYRQSDMHNLLKVFFSQEIQRKTNKYSQFEKRKESLTTKVVVLNNKAYWVDNNMFYIGDSIDGKVLQETATPINTEDLSKNEISKLLFILDKLKNGNYNDSGSAGNKGI
jgi:hypothetical protein